MRFFDKLTILSKKLKGLGAVPLYVGGTVLGQDITGYHVGGYRGPQIIIQGGIHAREYVTALVVLEQAIYAQEEHNREPILGGFYFVPLVNIDGARLCVEGLDWINDNEIKERLFEYNNQSNDFTLWKANAAGVDLNTNFDACWGRGQYNVDKPAPSDYIGPRPHSEPEVLALVHLTQKAQPSATVSYHARGREIYWQFYQSGERLRFDKKFAKEAAKVTGYKVIDGELDSAGGYKDWCVLRCKIPSLTIEILDENTPFPIDLNCIEEDIERNKNLPLALLSLLR